LNHLDMNRCYVYMEDHRRINPETFAGGLYAL
jgi:hypothetical protein